MFMTDVNETKIYNLSAGKSLPEVRIEKSQPHDFHS